MTSLILFFWLRLNHKALGQRDFERKFSADNQVKRICACTSERTKIAIRQLTSGEFMQSIKDEIFVSNYSTNDSRTIPPSHKMCDTSLYTKEAMFFVRSPGTETPWYEESDGIWELGIN